MSGAVQCELCPRQCIIDPDRSGDCRIRVNMAGRLTAVTYGYPCAVHADPVEKKPVYHFLPGTATFSLATVGCNLHCKNCQNWEISQQDPDAEPAAHLPPEAIPGLARQSGCRSVSYTYTDPVVYYEYALDSSIRAREAGLRTILVTAGYINRDPARELFRHADAARIDLKALSDKFYRDICEARLKPVLDTLVLARAMGLHVEVVHLIVPTLNDADGELRSLCAWIRSELGADIPLHFSRFFPHYRLQHLPPTPAETLYRARQIAGSEGLRYVYIGNILDEGSAVTRCPKCGEALLRRRGYEVLENKLRGGACPACATEIYGIWS